MRKNVKLEVHAYAEDKLCDECLDDPPFYGINGPAIMKPLADGRGVQFQFEYDNTTTSIDLIAAIKNKIKYTDECWYVETYFTVNNDRYEFCEEEPIVLKNVIDKYYNSTDIITITLLVSCDAGEVWNEHPLRYYVHSKEAGRHSLPHIHVTDCGHEYEASICIYDGKIIEGNLPTKYQKKAQRLILENQDYFIDCWNNMTDGLYADINHHFNFVEY